MWPLGKAETAARSDERGVQSVMQTDHVLQSTTPSNRCYC